MSMTTALINAFESGRTFTAEQIANSFNTQHPYKLVQYLRKKGYNVTQNRGVYRLGEAKKIELLREAFLSGESYSTEEISEKFGLSNPRDSVYRLRNEGYCINYTNGEYVIGEPSRELIAAGYRALRLGL